MSRSAFNPVTFCLLAALVVAGAAVRVLLRDVPNFAPVAALALFAGYYCGSARWAWAVPVGVMLLSNLVLGGYGGGWAGTAVMLSVYGSLTLPVLAGPPLRRWFERSHPAAAAVVMMGVSLLGSCLFFVITNWAAWMWFGMYSRDLSGLLHSYAQALPFFRATLVGDLAFAMILFGGYATLAGWRSPAETDDDVDGPSKLAPVHVRR